jgi:membrane protease YdiL (CAAX protease family)
MEIAVQQPLADQCRTRSAIGLLMITGAAGLALSLFSAEIALGGSIAERLLVPLRMLALVAAATLLLRWSGESWGDVGLHKPVRWGRSAALVVGGYIAVTVTYVVLAQLLLPQLGLAPKSAALFGSMRGDLAELLYWLIFIAWGSAAFGEELVFRGYIQSRIEHVIGSTRGAALLALIGQAVIFGMLHVYLGAGGAILAGATGLIIGLVYLAGGRNLWPCIVLHGLIDTVSLTAVYFGAAG